MRRSNSTAGGRIDVETVYNLTVNPDENQPFNYPTVHSWMLYEIYGPLARELMQSLADDSVPSGAPADFDPTKVDDEPDHPLLEKLGEFFHAR